MPVLQDWITVSEAATEVLGVTPQRVHQLIKAYELRVKRLGGHMLLVWRDDVQSLAQKTRPSGVHLESQPKPRRKRA